MIKLPQVSIDLFQKKIREHYGEYSGYAQQFLYYNIREENSRSW